MKQITITKSDGSKGILTETADGTYDVNMGGQSGGSLYYAAAQVDAIVTRMQSVAGVTVDTVNI